MFHLAYELCRQALRDVAGFFVSLIWAILSVGLLFVLVAGVLWAGVGILSTLAGL